MSESDDYVPDPKRRDLLQGVFAGGVVGAAALFGATASEKSSRPKAVQIKNEVDQLFKEQEAIGQQNIQKEYEMPTRYFIDNGQNDTDQTIHAYPPPQNPDTISIATGEIGKLNYPIPKDDQESKDEAETANRIGGNSGIEINDKLFQIRSEMLQKYSVVISTDPGLSYLRPDRVTTDATFDSNFSLKDALRLGLPFATTTALGLEAANDASKSENISRRDAIKVIGKMGGAATAGYISSQIPILSSNEGDVTLPKYNAQLDVEGLGDTPLEKDIYAYNSENFNNIFIRRRDRMMILNTASAASKRFDAIDPQKGTELTFSVESGHIETAKDSSDLEQTRVEIIQDVASTFDQHIQILDKYIGTETEEEALILVGYSLGNELFSFRPGLLNISVPSAGSTEIAQQRMDILKNDGDIANQHPEPFLHTIRFAYVARDKIRQDPNYSESQKEAFDKLIANSVNQLSARLAIDGYSSATRETEDGNFLHSLAGDPNNIDEEYQIGDNKFSFSNGRLASIDSGRFGPRVD